MRTLTCKRTPRKPQLSVADWIEVYYALQYKLTSPAVMGSDKVAREWRDHLNAILEKIGPDGKNMWAKPGKR